MCIAALAAIDEKFAAKLVQIEECICWTGSLRSYGYGGLHRGTKVWLTHRYAWTLLRGPIPPNMNVLHTHAGNRTCVNPEHLYLGTQSENNKDAAKHGNRKGPFKKRLLCKQGHNAWRHTKRQRYCSICNKETMRKRRASRKSI